MDSDTKARALFYRRCGTILNMEDNSTLHKALIVLQTHINAQFEALGHAFVFMKQAFPSTEASNIYLKYLDHNHGASAQGQLIVALTVETHKTPEELFDLLQVRMEKHPNTVDFYLVLYEDETRLTPQLTLPSPDFHNRPSWLVPAAELWAAAVHPVLNKSLYELAGENEWQDWGAFYAQGKTLLDFYYKQRK